MSLSDKDTNEASPEKKIKCYKACCISIEIDPNAKKACCISIETDPNAQSFAVSNSCACVIVLAVVYLLATWMTQNFTNFFTL